MIPRNQQNRKQRINLNCLNCGMKLNDPRVEGYTTDGQTYCCRGCGTGKDCTCKTTRAAVSAGKSQTARKKTPQVPSRGRRLRDGSKPLQGQEETRDSTRTQARGQSVQAGKMVKR